MLYAIIANDKFDHFEVRKKTRPDHLVYLSSLGDKLKFAGPFLDAQGNSIGSLVVVDAESFHEAEELASNDPYAKAKLFLDVKIRPWNWTINNPDHQ